MRPVRRWRILQGSGFRGRDFLNHSIASLKCTFEQTYEPRYSFKS